MMTPRWFKPFRILVMLFVCFASLSFTTHGQESDLTGNQSRAPFVDCTSAVGIDDGDCKALVKLYKKTGGTNWINNTGWLETDTPCTWYGVTCKGIRVDTLILLKNHLAGKLPRKLKN